VDARDARPSLIDWSGALHSLAWWLAATNRWRTAMHRALRVHRPTKPVSCSRFRRRRGADCRESARLRVRRSGSGVRRPAWSLLRPTLDA